MYPQAVRIHYHNWDPRWDENAERGGIGIDRVSDPRPSYGRSKSLYSLTLY